MRAFRLTQWHREAELLEVDEPTPGAGEVVIKIGAAGACGSDLHFMYEDGAPPPFPLPFTLGHENAGWVHSLGAGVSGWEVGQAVAVHGPWACGACGRCTNGLDNYCEGPRSAQGSGGGLGFDGGMADYMLVPDPRNLVALPEGLSPVQGAPLTDAGLTPFHAVSKSLHKLSATSTAVVIGVGGLGHLAVQILKATTAAKVIVVDTKEEALKFGLSLGADLAIEAGDNTAREIRRATNRLGADAVIDFVGSDATLSLAASCVRSLGDVTCVGVGGGTLPFTFLRPAFGATVQSSYWGSIPELKQVLELAARGLVQAQITTYPLERASEAYRALAAGEIAGRAVVVP